MMVMVTTSRRKMTPARKRRIRDAHEGVCGCCHEQIEKGTPYEIDHAIPLALGGADDDGENTYPIHPSCHRLKTFGPSRTGRRADAAAIAKVKRVRAKRLGIARPKRRRLTDPRYVRKVDGTVVAREGTEGRMR